jgi:hypothetical protein
MDEFKGLITFKDRITYCDNNLKKISIKTPTTFLPAVEPINTPN